MPLDPLFDQQATPVLEGVLQARSALDRLHRRAHREMKSFLSVIRALLSDIPYQVLEDEGQRILQAAEFHAGEIELWLTAPDVAKRKEITEPAERHLLLAMQATANAITEAASLLCRQFSTSREAVNDRNRRFQLAKQLLPLEREYHLARQNIINHEHQVQAAYFSISYDPVPE